MVTTINSPRSAPPPWQLHATARKPQITCQTCKDTKLVLDPSQRDDKHPLGRPIPCPACNGAAEVGFDRDLTKLTKAERAYSFGNLITDRSNLDTVAMLKQLTEQDQPVGLLYIHGPLGTGKSRLVITTINQCRHRGLTVCYGSATAIADYIKDAMRTGDDQRARMNHIATTPVLAIDDWDRQLHTEYTRQLLQELFDTRYRMAAEALTIVGSNQAPDECEPYIHDRLSDLQAVTCIALAATSWRPPVTDWIKD